MVKAALGHDAYSQKEEDEKAEEGKREREREVGKL
jgi:hypothetical protein